MLAALNFNTLIKSRKDSVRSGWIRLRLFQTILQRFVYNKPKKGGKQIIWSTIFQTLNWLAFSVGSIASLTLMSYWLTSFYPLPNKNSSSDLTV